MALFPYNFVPKGKSLGLVTAANKVRARVGFRIRIRDYVSGLLIWKLSPSNSAIPLGSCHRGKYPIKKLVHLRDYVSPLSKRDLMNTLIFQWLFSSSFSHMFVQL